MEWKNYLAILCSSAFKPSSNGKRTETQAHLKADIERLRNMSNVNSTLKYLIKDYNHVCFINNGKTQPRGSSHVHIRGWIFFSVTP